MAHRYVCALRTMLGPAGVLHLASAHRRAVKQGGFALCACCFRRFLSAYSVKFVSVAYS